MPSVPVLTVLSDALFEVNSLSPGETIEPGLGEFVLGRANQILDNWNAQREAVWAEEFLEFTFVPNQQTYTIGPNAADFSVSVRPVSIELANVVLNTNPPVFVPITVRDYQWWAGVSVRNISGTYPTDVYYQPDWPNGELNFYLIPTVAYGLELVTRVALGVLTMQGVLNMPPGYQNALMLTLAEDIGPALGKQISPKTETKARQARARIFANNSFVPQIATQDAGMPSSNRNRTDWNFLNGGTITSHTNR